MLRQSPKLSRAKRRRAAELSCNPTTRLLAQRPASCYLMRNFRQDFGNERSGISAARPAQGALAARISRFDRHGARDPRPAHRQACRKSTHLTALSGLTTPSIEFADALGKFLPDQDRPHEGVFSFQDDDGQWLVLRYDLTAPLARYVAENFDIAGVSLSPLSDRLGVSRRKARPRTLPRIRPVRRRHGRHRVDGGGRRVLHAGGRQPRGARSRRAATTSSRSTTARSSTACSN